MSGWGSSWDKPMFVWPVKDDEVISIGVDLGKGDDLTVYHQNKIPTHDPYTNPGAYIYYQCECGDTFDPQVKRFSELNNAAMTSKWKIRWGQDHYIPYCPKCVEEKGIE